MKRKLLLTIIVSVGILSMSGCISKEKKAAKLIKTELAKSLYDFESYQPVETIVKEAKCSRFNDSACWSMASILAETSQTFSDFLEKAKNAQREMLIWESTSSHSSPYAISRYNEFIIEYIENLEDYNNALINFRDISLKLHDMIENLDTSKVIGWEVDHTFRCKTKGGFNSIAHYRYLISKDFKSVFFFEDTESDKDHFIKEALVKVSDLDNLSFCSEEVISATREQLSKLKENL